MVQLVKWIFILLFFSPPAFAQQLRTKDIAKQWQDSGLGNIEGIYAIHNKTLDNFEDELVYGVIRYYNSYRLFVYQYADSSCNVVGTLSKLSEHSFLSNIVLFDKLMYNIEMDFDDDFNTFNIPTFTRYEFVKIFPKNKEEVSNESHSITSVIDLELSEGGVFEIPVIINEVLRLFFIIDTGASETQISPDVALTLIRSHTINDSDWLKGRVYVFADGSSAYSNRFMLKSVTIGDIKIRNVAVSISNSIDAPILLGQNVLKRLGDIHINYDKNQLEIKK